MNGDTDSHPSESRLLAYLDGELAPDERARVSRHLADCGPCARTAYELRAASEGLTSALSRLETPDSRLTARDVHRAAGSSEARGDAAEDGTGRDFARGTALRIAASVAVLLGAAAALPGSPVRSWIGRSVQEVQAFLGAGPDAAERPEPERPAPPSAQDDRSGVAVGPERGAVRVRLVRVPGDATVRVRLVDGARAGVWNAGGQYRTAAGRIEVTAPTSDEILVELPRSVSTVRLEVNGETAAVKRDGRIDVRVPGVALRDGEFEFTPGGTGTQ